MDDEVNPKTRMGAKREVPPPLQKLLEWDVKATKQFVSFLLNFKAVEQFKKQCKFLEWSCHGLVWLVCWIGFIYMIDSTDLYQTQVNMFIGLVIDIVAVAVIKSITRRRRPAIDDNPLSFGPDKYAFPSGHASRAVFVACFFTILDPVPWIFYPPIIAWCTSVCFSRLLIYRHHILDVLAGAGLGIFEALLLSIFWCNQSVSHWLINFMTDEKIEGASYDV
uniref:CSON005977 protein n=1 Tax=Culicoides sonorensis TaxID=179676 RepID=A0A336LDD4_CULSO